MGTHVDHRRTGRTRFAFDRGDGRPSLTDLHAWVRTSLSDLAADDLVDLLLLLTELVGDALDHTPGPGEVRLETSPLSGVVRIEVDDASPDLPRMGVSRLGPPAPRPWARRCGPRSAGRCADPRAVRYGWPGPGWSGVRRHRGRGFGETVRGTSGRVP